MMKIFAAALTFAMLASTSAFAKDVTYEMQVDGITCPFCVATSTKALKKIDGVKSVSADLETGVITVCADESVSFTDEQLKKMFLDKGFTYRSMTKREGCDAT
jgi:mercuric ion binding protein